MAALARKILDRAPILQGPAYLAWVASMGTKNAMLRFAFKRFGHVSNSNSDRGQDRWVIDDVFKGKTDGFFVELGAADGFNDSNTFVLEKRFGWKGLCIEPNPVFFDKLTSLAKRGCTLVQLGVDAESGTAEFLLDGQRSGLTYDDTSNSEAARGEALDKAKDEGRVAVIETVTLAEVFDRYKAPNVIDYFSFDVEGAETRILREFPFDRYTFLAMTIERPTPELNELLFKNGYHFVKNSLYDTFYIHESLPNFDEIERQPFEQLPAKKF